MANLKSNWLTGDQFSATAQNDVATAVNLLTNAATQFGTYASRPAAGNAGTIYYCSDTDSIYRDNGASWDLIRVAGGASSLMAAPPTFSGGSVLNSAAFSSSFGERLLTPSGVNANWSIEYNTLFPTSNFTARAYFDINVAIADDSWQGASMILYDTGSGKFISFGYGYDPSTPMLQHQKWNSVTSFNSVYTTTAVATNMLYNLRWFQIRDDGTNWNFEYSFNGIDFISFGAGVVKSGAFMTPNVIGWGATAISTVVRNRLRSWKIA